jgi:uncharacterized protein (TIGR03067 family)
MKPRLVILVACGFVTFAAGKLRAADIESDLKKLQGEWVSVSYEEARSPKDSRTVKLTFKGNKVTMNIAGKTEKDDCDLNVDEEPKWMDIVEREGIYVTSVNKGIYKLQGDTLTICHGGAIRPTKFEVRNGKFLVDSLIVLERKRQ